MHYYGNGGTSLDVDLEKKYWDYPFNDITKMTLAYITHQHDPITPSSNISDKIVYYNTEISKSIVNELRSMQYEQIINAIDVVDSQMEISTVPLFNDYYNGTYGICQYLATVPYSNYIDTGTHFTSEHNLVTARQKYGEEHLKLGALLGFVALYRPTDSRVMVGKLTPLGEECLKQTLPDFESICCKLLFRIPIISLLIKRSKTSTVKIQDAMNELGMKNSTIQRRTQSVKILIKKLQEINSEELSIRLSKIYW